MCSFINLFYFIYILVKMFNQSKQIRITWTEQIATTFSVDWFMIQCSTALCCVISEGTQKNPKNLLMHSEHAEWNTDDSIIRYSPGGPVLITERMRLLVLEREDVGPVQQVQRRHRPLFTKGIQTQKPHWQLRPIEQHRVSPMLGGGQDGEARVCPEKAYRLHFCCMWCSFLSLT